MVKGCEPNPLAGETATPGIGPQQKPAGLYIHIPFCDIRCGYCDFFTLADRHEQIPAYLSALHKELDSYAATTPFGQAEFDSIFLGGGTPSLLNPHQVDSLLSFIHSRFTISVDTEITLETNPGTVDLAKLRDLRSAGVNRLSLGVQSFRPEELLFLDRDHSVDDSIRCYDHARKAGFDNINFDLISGLPSQSVQEWQFNLQTTIELGPNHISAYNLTFEDGTPLTAQLRRGVFRRPPTETERRMLLLTVEMLAAHDYPQYEISNFAHPGATCRHNEKYWNGNPYLGVGASAHSYVSGKRFWNVSNLKAYLEGLEQKQAPIAGEEVLTNKELDFERAYLGLRQRSGINLRHFEAERGVSVFTRYASTLHKFFSLTFEDPCLNEAYTNGNRSLQGKHLCLQDGHLRLTREGVLVCDAICSEFV